jgi:hypothetical protein
MVLSIFAGFTSLVPKLFSGVIAARIVGRVERMSGGESVVSVRAAHGNFDYSR